VSTALEAIAALLLAVAAVWFTLQPIFIPSAAPAEDAAAEGEDPEEDTSPRAVALRALKEIEFDRATGKLDDRDYESLTAKYTAAALTALRTEGGGGSETPRVMPAPPVARAAPSCPTHGPRSEPAAEFCAECGRRLGASSATGYCARCGKPLAAEASYCNDCGTRVAA